MLTHVYSRGQTLTVANRFAVVITLTDKALYLSPRLHSDITIAIPLPPSRRACLEQYQRTSIFLSLLAMSRKVSLLIFLLTQRPGDTLVVAHIANSVLSVRLAGKSRVSSTLLPLVATFLIEPSLKQRGGKYPNVLSRS